MSWSPNDLLTDADLVAYEQTILTQFGQTDWADRRSRVLNDWLFPLLESHKFDPTHFRTRHTQITAFGYTSSVYTDRTSAADASTLNLATVLASANDALYVGFEQPFLGVLLTMTDTVGSATTTLSAAYWNGTWASVPITDGTRIGGKSLARGGSVTWKIPDGAIRRSLNSSTPLYWVRLMASAAPTGATACGPILAIRRSRLCAAVTFRTLALIFREAPISADGPWLAKAEWYEAEADRAFSRVVELLGPEFDSDDSDAIDEGERAQTAAEVSGGGWTFERG